MKETKKQIEANLRNKLARQYNQEREYQRERYSKLWCDYMQKCDEAKALNNKIYELQDKIDQYEDWIHRLQEFCNMNEDEREVAIKKYKEDQKFKTYIENSEFFKMFDSFLGMNLFEL
jgi:hypothetical protein